MSYPEAPFLSRTELPLQNTHTTGGTGGPGRRASGQTTLQTSSNRSNVKPLARTLVTNVVNLRPKTLIFSEKALRLTTFVTTDQKSTRKTPWIDDVCNNKQQIGQKSQLARPLRCPRAAPQRPGPTGVEGAGGSGGPGCGARGRRRGLAGLRGDAPSNISDQAPLAWRAPEGSAAVPVGGGRAWPGFETTRRAKLAARTASGRAAAHRHTQRPGPPAPGTPAGPQAPTRNADGSRAGRRPRAHQAARPSRAHEAARPSRKQ